MVPCINLRSFRWKYSLRNQYAALSCKSSCGNSEGNGATEVGRRIWPSSRTSLYDLYSGRVRTSSDRNDGTRRFSYHTLQTPITAQLIWKAFSISLQRTSISSRASVQRYRRSLVPLGVKPAHKCLGSRRRLYAEKRSRCAKFLFRRSQKEVNSLSGWGAGSPFFPTHQF